MFRLRKNAGKKARVKLLTSGGYFNEKIAVGDIVEATIKDDFGVDVFTKNTPEGLYFMDGEIEILEIL